MAEMARRGRLAMMLQMMSARVGVGNEVERWIDKDEEIWEEGDEG